MDVQPRFELPEHEISPSRQKAGRLLIRVSTVILLLLIAGQTFYKLGYISLGFETWRPLLYAYIAWGIALGAGHVLSRGEAGKRALFVLPAVLFTIALVIFPTVFGLYIAFTDWNLSSFDGRKFNGWDNFRSMLDDPYYWNAMLNMVFYVLAIFIEFIIAFGLALLLNADIKARKFFRIVFLLPFMLSPVAVSWMIGKSMMEYRFGPAARLARYFGWESPAFFASPITAKISIMIMDAWMFIPFMMILILAGLQAIPKDIQEASRVDGATPWQSFWKITFPLMLPVSLTAIILRIIFKLKLADIVINVTSGGPGGATDTVTSYIFREYRDRSNVGYGTMLAEVYLICIIIFMLILLAIVGRFIKRPSDPGEHA